VTTHITRQSNGLRIASTCMESVETVSLGAWVNIGARDETKSVNGISHILEHMAFKGTKKRNAYEIAETIEAVGGHLNAYTSREQTAYYAKVLKQDAPLAIELISDILQNSVFDEQELVREKDVIIQEIHQTADTPDDLIFDLFQETAYPDQAMGRPILGTSERVSAMDRTTLKSYMQDNYTAPSMVISAAGNIGHERFQNEIAQAFSQLPPDPTQTLSTRDKTQYKGGELIKHRDLEQTHVVLGFDGVSYYDDDFYAASVFSTLLGGGMSSRLFQQVREKRGLAYSIYSFLSCCSDSGFLAIYAGTGKNEAAQLLPIIADEISKVCDQVDLSEIARARAQLKASTLMALESTSSRTEQLARQVQLFDRAIPTEETVAKIDAVDVNAVKNIATRIFKGIPTLTVLGPVEKSTGLDQIVGKMPSS